MAKSELSGDYSDDDRGNTTSGVDNSNIPAKGSPWAKILVGLLIAVVIGFLLTRMPFLAGSLNAGAPAGEAVTGGIGSEEVDIAPALPDADETTPATVPQ